MALAMVASIVGFVAVVMTTSWEYHFQSFHGILGMMVFILFVVQFMLGMYIDKWFNANRQKIPLRDKTHWVLGILICFLSVITMILGHLSYSTSLGFLLLHVAVILAWMIGFGIAQRNIGQTHDSPHENESSAAELNAM
jgi:amino acid transporter